MLSWLSSWREARAAEEQARRMRLITVSTRACPRMSKEQVEQKVDEIIAVQKKLSK